MNATVRGLDVWLIQPIGPPVNDHTMELLLSIAALKRSGARHVTAVVPYFAYARHQVSSGRGLQS